MGNVTGKRPTRAASEKKRNKRPDAANETSPPSRSASVADDGADPSDADLRTFKYEKGVCALTWWQPVKLLEEGSISDIHLCRRRKRPIKVRYKDKRDLMNFAKKNPCDDCCGADGVDGCDGPLFVLKSIMKDHIGDDRVMDEMRAEIETMSRLDHPNVVKLYEAYERRRHIYLVLEYCAGGNLADRTFAERESSVVCRKVLSAVAFLHSRGVVHRDLKLENVMLDGAGEIKLIDFGLATKYLSDEYKVMTDKVGTLYSMAPQVLQGVYTSKCDLWSVGVISYLLLSGGQQPFYGPPRSMPWAKRRKIMIDRIMRCRYQEMVGPKWEAVSSAAKDFVTSLLQMDPDDRPTAEEALNHPWIERRDRSSSKEVDRSVISCNEQSMLRSVFRRKVWDLLTTKLSAEDVVSLRTVLEARDEAGNGHVRIDTFRALLENETTLPGEDVAALFSDDALDASRSINYVDLMVEVLTGCGRNMVDDLARALDDLDVEGTRTVPVEKLRPTIESRLSSEMKEDLWKEVRADGNGDVSTSQVLEFVSKRVAKRTRDSIRTERSNEDEIVASRDMGENDDDGNHDLVDEANAIIPGGRQNSGEGSRSAYFYNTERKEMLKV